jgi:hypothetical protein
MYNPVSPRFRTKKNRIEFVSAISFGCSKIIYAYHQKRKGRKNCVQKLWQILILIFCKSNIFLQQRAAGWYFTEIPEQYWNWCRWEPEVDIVPAHGYFFNRSSMRRITCREQKAGAGLSPDLRWALAQYSP